MNRSISARLSVMMFLQYFIWGAWYTVIAVYMSNHDMSDLTHWPFTVNPLAAIVAPFFLGLIADRFFDSEKIYGVLHILGGIVMFIVPMTAGHAGLFIGLLLLYNLCYMPTISLANSVAFSHIGNQEKEFPVIRVFGTIGWIVAGLIISFVLVYFVADVPERTAAPLQMAAAASVLLGLYSFTLPQTPPAARGERYRYGASSALTR
jgi:MFS family permease